MNTVSRETSDNELVRSVSRGTWNI